MSKNMFDLTGKKALVTGASRGIGEGIALALARQGADIIINFSTNKDKALEVEKSIIAMGRKTMVVGADISNEKDVKEMMETVREKWGGINILVNNAGVLGYSPLSEMTIGELNRVIDTNLKGCFLVTKEGLKIIEPEKQGRIINIASIASGQIGMGAPNASHYDASKGGMIAFSESIACELSGRNITINCIAPGIIETDMVKGLTEDKKTADTYLARIPAKRFGRPKDIGVTAVFLASDEAEYITGTVIYVDGGWLAS